MSITIEHLSYAYPDGTSALRDVSLAVRPGEVVGLLGPNGAGKSTLLLHLNGTLLADGCVAVGGLPITRRTLAEVRRRVGLVFQDPDDQLFMLRVWDDVAFGAINQGHDRETVARKVQATLETVGMLGFEERSPHHLSLGEKKRIAIATVLVTACEILALDEPTAGLDPRGRRELIRFLAGLRRTQVIATHDLEMAVTLCDRVILLDAGRVVADGPPHCLLADESLMERHGLEVPASLRTYCDRCRQPIFSALADRVGER